MSNRLTRALVGSISTIALGAGLLIAATPPHANATLFATAHLPQGSGGTAGQTSDSSPAGTKHTYDRNTHTVTVTTGAGGSTSKGGSSTGRGGTTTDHTGMKQVCGVWLPQDTVIDPNGCFTKVPKPGSKPRPTTEQSARNAIAQLTLPTNTPQIGPNPKQNQWNMIPVGYPIWLWTNDNPKLTQTVTQDGLTITITATRQQITYKMGDNKTTTCKTFTTRPTHLPNDPMDRWGFCAAGLLCDLLVFQRLLV